MVGTTLSNGPLDRSRKLAGLGPGEQPGVGLTRRWHVVYQRQRRFLEVGTNVDNGAHGVDQPFGPPVADLRHPTRAASASSSGRRAGHCRSSRRRSRSVPGPTAHRRLSPTTRHFASTATGRTRWSRPTFADSISEGHGGQVVTHALSGRGAGPPPGHLPARPRARRCRRAGRAVPRATKLVR